MGIFDSLMPGEESGMPTGILNQSGWRGALEGNNAMMNIGLGILANNSGNYGSAMAALGKGAQQGVQNTQTSRQARMQQAIYKMKLDDAKKALEQQQKQQEWLKTYGQPNATQDTTTQAPDAWQNAMQGQTQPNFNMERVAGQQTTTQTPIFDQNKALLSGVQNGVIDFKDYLSMQQEQAQKEQNAKLMETILGNQGGQQNNGGLDRNTLNRLGVAQSLSGGKGGDAIMKYAETMKPSWQNVGGKLVDANQFNGEIPVNPTPMSEAEKARGAYEGWLPPQAQPSAPQVSQAQPDGYKYNTSISPKANNDLAVKYEGAKIDKQFKDKNKGLSVAAQKELIDAEDGIQGSKEAVKAFNQAISINKQAMGGFGSGALATIGSVLPDFARPEIVDKTKELDNVLQGSALPQLKAIFGGMPTEGERAILLEVQGSSSQPASVREGIFKRAIASAESRIKYNTEKAKKLRSGTYFTEDGGINVEQSMSKDEPMPTKQQKSVITKIGGKSVSLKLGNDGLYYDAQGNGYRKPK
jgi:hypothetical protein